jgi:hypothetical protein
MPIWEYLYVNEIENHVKMVNHVELRDWKRGPRVVDYLNQMGQQGWELVTYAYFSMSNAAVAVMKRRVA